VLPLQFRQLTPTIVAPTQTQGGGKKNKQKTSSSLTKHYTAEEWGKLSVDECTRIMKLQKEKKAQHVSATTTQPTPKISSVTTLPPVSVKPVAPTIVVPEVAPDASDAIASNVSFVSSCPDPDWITKAMAASRHEATLENQVVEARFAAMVVPGHLVIELLDDDDNVGLDVALGEAPGVTPGVVPGTTFGVVPDTDLVATPTSVPGISSGVALGDLLGPSPAPDVKPSYKTNEMATMKPFDHPHERLQRFKFYRDILAYLVMFGTILPPPKGNAKEYFGCHTDALLCPVCLFDWSPFPYYWRYQFTWSVFPD
jgi:hypothetical protein